MKRVIILATAALLVMMLFAPVAMAQDMEGTMMGSTMMEQTAGTEATDIPDSGGPAILLPAAALLLGSGILTFAVLRRR